MTSASAVLCGITPWWSAVLSCIGRVTEERNPSKQVAAPNGSDEVWLLLLVMMACTWLKVRQALVCTSH